MAFERFYFIDLTEFSNLDSRILFSGDCENNILVDFILAFHNQTYKSNMKNCTL